MSATTSAFAAYSTSASKKGANKSKQNQKANNNVCKTKNNTATTKATTVKNANKNEKAPVITKSSGAATGAAKDVPKVNGTTSKAPIKAKATGAKPTVTKANATDQKPITKGNVAAAKKTTAKVPNGNAKGAVASGTKSVQNKVVSQLNENNVDAWVEELMSGKTKLTKEQKERKIILEKYLLSLQNSEHEDEYEDEESEMDEYTMNSYYEESGEEESSWSDVSGEEEEISGTDSDDNAGAITQNITSQKSATKRKSSDDTNNNHSKDNKKSHTITEQTITSPTNKKKSRQTIGETVPKATASKGDNKERRRTVADIKPSASNAGKQNIKQEPLSPSTSIATNSIEEGKKAFAWLINPINVNDFFQNYWEKKACYIKRNSVNNFEHLISFTAIDEMLINNHIEFTTNIDVTSYKNGIRETLNPEGRALPPSVWEHYSSGCSIRLLNPHTYMPNLFKLNTVLQEFFHCLVGANAYLTPPNSQGFAPHYDDIEAFVLQIEGRKRWRLYKPIEDNDVLPRVSSRNFKPEEIGKPIFETVLMPGDVLYFPRGVIHQASTETGYHSLHITLSVYQKQSYADLLEKLMPLVLEHAIKRNLNLRRGLPLNTFQHLGLVHSGSDSQERSDMQEKITTLAEKHLTLHSSLIDAAVDQLAKKYQHEALPPDLNNAEIMRTIRGSRTVTDARGNCRCDYELQLNTNVRLLRANVLRLVREDGGRYRVYFYVDNARVYCKYEPNFIEIEATEAGTIEMLVRSYPAYVGVSQFPIEDDDRKLDVATALFERGLIMTEKPFR